MGTPMQNISRHQTKLTPNSEVFELCSQYEALKFQNDEVCGLGERYMWTMKKKVEKIHQVDPSGYTETCGSVCERSIKLAEAIIEKGIRPQNVIMITSKSHSDQTVALLGSLFAGAVVAPTDPDMDLSDTEWFVTKLNPKMIFCDVRCLGALQKTTRKQKLDCVFIIFGSEKNEAICFSKLLNRSLNPSFEPPKIKDPKSTLAFVIPTQGTTGKSKLVDISHYAITYQTACISEYLLKDVKTFMSFFPLCWHVQTLLSCVCFEFPITKIFPGTFNERIACKLIHDLKIDCIVINPFQTIQLTNKTCAQDFDLSRLKKILVGGAQMCTSIIKMVSNVFMKVKICVWYSITEIGVVSSFQVDDMYSVLQDNLTCGLLYPGMRVKILDVETGNELRQNMYGEVCISGPCMMMGYHNEYMKNDIKNNFFLTNDIGYYNSNGYLYVRGRKSDFIRRDEEEFCLIDIENILVNNIYVLDSVVVCDGDFITACVIKTEDATDLTVEKLMKYVTDRLPRERWPNEIKFFDTLPYTSIGKVKRQVLKQKLSKKYEVKKCNSVMSI